MSSSSSSFSSSSSSSSSEEKWPHDVFINFRGEDVRSGFVADLHKCLLHGGINAYIDSVDLRRGDEIESALTKAIEESRIAVLVFSKDYASSRWCLDELVKVMECRRLKGQRVLPVFYKVEPGVIQELGWRYGDTLARDEGNLGQDSERVDKWRQALIEAAKLAGWHYVDAQSQDDTKFIESIVKEISTIVAREPLNVAKNPVGVGRRVEKVMSLLSMGSDDVRMIGIWGTGGVGKTTISKDVYNSIARQFDGCSFLANVRETSDRLGLVHLQKTLLSQILWKENLVFLSVDRGANLIRDILRYRKILLVLDDVDDVEQLNALARECEWFGKGSRIIVTTRDKHVLTSQGINWVYEVKLLDQDEAFELLSSYALNQTNDISRDLIYNILGYANGLPLAIVVLGGLLCGSSRGEWESKLEELAESPLEDINKVLKISFDALKENEKNMFLDIACFFKGREMDYVTRVLGSYGPNPLFGIQTLIKRSLVTIEYGSIVQMHDLIQLMGQDVVKKESPDEPGKRSRLWCYDDVNEVLSAASGTNAVKGIVLQLPSQGELDISRGAFTHMRRLKLLILSNARISGGLVCPPDDLRWLELHGCHSSTLKFSARPKKLVCFDVRGNQIKKFEGNSKDFKNLKFLYFRECLAMFCMPNLDFCPNLEELDLSGCKNLERAHESVAYHAKLRLLNLEGCSNLDHLPDILQPKNLESLNLCGCSKLRRFPNIPDKMKCLEQLLLDETSIEELPPSIENLVSLETLSISCCKKLANLPSCIYKLPNLENLSLDGCSKLIKFPKEEEDSSDLHSTTGFPKLQYLWLGRCNLQEVEFLENHSCFPSLLKLDLSKNNFAKLPTCGHLHNLLELDVSECRQLQEIGKVSGQLLELEARNCESLSKIPSDILSIKRLFCDLFHNKQFRESGYSLPLETILPGGEMPQWLLLNKEGYISFTASKDLYEKFLRLAICVVFRVKEGVKEGKQNYFKLIPYINGKHHDMLSLPRSLPIMHSDHVFIQLHVVKELWGVDPFGPNDSSSFQLGIKAWDGAIVKTCGFRLICEPLEDDLEALNQYYKLLDPSLIYEIDEETTSEEEVSADLPHLEKRRVGHEDNYQTNSEEDDIRPKKKQRKDVDMDNSSSADMMADFSVERGINHEDNYQTSSEEADGIDDSPPANIMADFSVEKWRYSEIAPHYMDIRPGGDIPEEFIIVDSNTISFMVSQDFYDKFMILALCVVFTVEDGEKEIFFNIVPHLNDQKRNGLSGSLGSFNSNHMWIQCLKPNVLWGVLEGAVDFPKFDKDCLQFSLTLSVSGGIMKKLGYLLKMQANG